ncbi:DinB family protein [Mucilaginibacter pedocola]|uniref:Damage-inducible protein DinB n=1 Tax=Mucilaginibacter pedocola TaxID=1792845 RepID=A0A1S9P8I8_9SPHI|nr:DinB family protein [Mucilaginibacter pedocola]OOQ57290.1 damage-inducible protein DinB [Mucilaginibacter pedocola]
MKAIKLLAALCIILCSTTIKAQTPNDALLKDWERAKAYTKEYLDAMPEASYGLKPTPEMRSFAAQMLHLADTNYGFASAASGETSPIGMGALEKTTDVSKAGVTKSVLDSYDFVIASLKKLTPEKLNEQIKLFGRFDLSRKQVFEKAFEHQTHQRGQTAPYLHLAGLQKAPGEKLF